MANIDDDLKQKREQLKKEQKKLKEKRSLLKQKNLEGRPFNSEQVTITKKELKNIFPDSLTQEDVNNAKTIIKDNLEKNEEINQDNIFGGFIEKEVYSEDEELKEDLKEEKELTPSHNSSTNYNFILHLFIIGIIFFVSTQIITQINDANESENIFINELSNVSNSMTNVIIKNFLNNTIPLIAICVVLLIPIIIILSIQNNLR